MCKSNARTTGVKFNFTMFKWKNSLLRKRRIHIEGVLLIAMVVYAYFSPTEHSGYTQSRAGMEFCSFLGADCFPSFLLCPARLQPLSYRPVMELWPLPSNFE